MPKRGGRGISDTTGSEYVDRRVPGASLDVSNARPLGPPARRPNAGGTSRVCARPSSARAQGARAVAVATHGAGGGGAAAARRGGVAHTTASGDSSAVVIGAGSSARGHPGSGMDEVVVTGNPRLDAIARAAGPSWSSDITPDGSITTPTGGGAGGSRPSSAPPEVEALMLRWVRRPLLLLRLQQVRPHTPCIA
jgi:hypothetical protein